ncbi:MAG: efflux RND transporter permease subunit, partial [Candidatus Marinimicrobia bacterium]|nr:efflux RND transporter permease subunit [Candidatus Neomarinimicrobiota bacterium]
MKRLIEYFIKYPVSGNVIIFLILALGYFGFISLKSTTMPQTDPGSILVTAQYPGASPEEIEQGIILKIETSLRGVSGIKKISSTSQENFGRATVEVISGYNTDLVLQD